MELGIRLDFVKTSEYWVRQWMEVALIFHPGQCSEIIHHDCDGTSVRVSADSG
jgi:hypothetical protein